MIEELIPAGIRSRLTQSVLFAGTSATAQLIERNFKLSGTPFFREYTDHSFKHCIEVFNTACDIISDKSLEIVSSDDLNILILACMLHDAGLHVTEDMFIALTAQENNSIAVSAFDFKSWPELWTEFVAEAKRFSAKKLISIFGSNEAIREPPRQSINMTARDRLLIGEFLRRHHSRYAHEFALGVIPDVKGGRFEFKNLDPPVQDMVGLVARSHGIELRTTFDYVQHRYDLRDYNRVHLLYLMTLLRIADYLQIQPGRAPQLFGKLHNIKSPFSLGEWRLHQCIENITTSSLDPEAIFVAASPKTIHEYLKFEKWSDGLQRELDRSWAILGEVYGRFTREALDKLQLNLRRIRTNLEDKVILQKRVPFVPDAINFTVAEPELLNLLIAPLYGDDPLYGIRELAQNAADSIREIRHLMGAGELLDSNWLTLKGDIELYVSMQPSPHILISDRGTGMTLDVIKNYFLRAGASFRNSDLWKRQFEDAKGLSQVARAGRFGVGALSAFLIGDRVEVYTRHFSDQSGAGLAFAANIDEDEIEILQQRGKFGTSIKVTSDERRIQRIADYFRKIKTVPYCFESVDVNLVITIDVNTGANDARDEDDNEEGGGKYLTGAIGERDEGEDRDAGEWNLDDDDEQKYWDKTEKRAAAVALALKPNWISVTNTKYHRVRWDRNNHAWRGRWGKASCQCGYLFCNDLLVGDLDSPAKNLIVRNKYIGDVWEITAPTVSVTDKNSLLPLDLARKRFARPDNELTDSILRSMWCEFLSTFFYSRKSRASDVVKIWLDKDFLFESEWIPFIFGRMGFTVLDEMRLHVLAPKRLIVLPQNEGILERILKDPFLDNGTFVLMRGERLWLQSRSNIVSAVSGAHYRTAIPDFRERFGGVNRTFKSANFVFEKMAFEDTLELRQAPKYLKAMLETGQVFKVGNRRGIVVSREAEDLADERPKIAKCLERVYENAPDQFTEDVQRPMVVYSAYSNPHPRTSRLSQVWEESFDSKLIPYSYPARRAILRSDAPIGAFEKI